MGSLKILLKSYEFSQHHKTTSHLTTSRQLSSLYKQKSIGITGCGHVGMPPTVTEPWEREGENADGHMGLIMENRLRASAH